MANTEAAPARAGAREWAGMAVLALPVLLLSLDLTVLHLAAPALGADLGASGTQLLWILDVYGFMVAGLLVTMGNLGDRIGRRRLLLIGAGAFGVASVAAAYAPTAAALIAARALLGVAGATLMPSTLGLVRALFRDPRQRALAIGVWSLAFTLGGAIGPIVGGVLLAHFWWGAAFLLGVPVMLLLLAAGPFLLPEERDASAGRIDLLSALQALGTMLPVVYALKEFAKDGFTAATAAALAVGAVFAVLFLRRQRRLEDPLVDLTLFRAPGFAAALGALLLSMTALGGVLMLFVQYLQMVRGHTALETGLLLLPGVAASVAGSLLAPLLARRARPAVLIGAGIVMAVAGLLLFAVVEPEGGLWPLVAGTVLMFLGLTPIAVLGTGLVVDSAPKKRASSASSLSETASELGTALSIALIGSVITAVYTTRMAAFAGAAPGGARDNLAAALDAAASLPSRDSAALLDAGRAAFTDALNTGALAAAAVLLAALAITTAALRRVPPLGESD
ncbi:MFS transporter [Glycomyces terrestris]|uniref:MFS transporter n=1 Tax=Glycomyces terrestris TaxID=2493553 RepID=A0A426UVW0_9ACTN|nr:MFS transporter [Glycomyces terrestris]RRR98460.1 MFS transporter [Glycomyces terrestris]